MPEHTPALNPAPTLDTTPTLLSEQEWSKLPGNLQATVQVTTPQRWSHHFQNMARPEQVPAKTVQVGAHYRVETTLADELMFTVTNQIRRSISQAVNDQLTRAAELGLDVRGALAGQDCAWILINPRTTPVRTGGFTQGQLLEMITTDGQSVRKDLAEIVKNLLLVCAKMEAQGRPRSECVEMARTTGEIVVKLHASEVEQFVQVNLLSVSGLTVAQAARIAADSSGRSVTIKVGDEWAVFEPGQGGKA